MYDVNENYKYGDSMRKWCLSVFLAALLLFVFGGCVTKDDAKKLRDVEFTVVKPEDVPQELQTKIQKEKGEFRLTYGDKGYLYAARGYGSQETSGYSVEVLECFETGAAIYVRTNLLGPAKEEEILEKTTYPYVVIKMEYTDKSVIFE